MGLFAQVAFHVRHHPRVRMLARELGCSRLLALGALTSLWTLAGEQAEDGFIDTSRWTVGDLEEDLMWDGEHGALVSGLVTSGWLVVEADGWSIPAWDEHTGAGLERRSKERARKRKWREKQGTGDADVPSHGGVPVPSHVDVPPGRNVPLELNRTELNRTEMKEQGTASADAPASGLALPIPSAPEIEDGALDEIAASKLAADDRWMRVIFEAAREVIRSFYGPSAGAKKFKPEDATAIRKMLREGAKPSDIMRAARGIRHRPVGGEPRPPSQMGLKYAARAWEECAQLSVHVGMNAAGGGHPPADTHGNPIRPPPGYVWNEVDDAQCARGLVWTGERSRPWKHPSQTTARI